MKSFFFQIQPISVWKWLYKHMFVYLSQKTDLKQQQQQNPGAG